MPRFFFDLRAGSHLTADPIGVDLSDWEAARALGLRRALVAWAELGDAAHMEEMAYLIADERRGSALTLPFCEAFEGRHREAIANGQPLTRIASPPADTSPPASRLDRAVFGGVDMVRKSIEGSGPLPPYGSCRTEDASERATKKRGILRFESTANGTHSRCPSEMPGLDG
jgi:hypothetical protein